MIGSIRSHDGSDTSPFPLIDDLSSRMVFLRALQSRHQNYFQTRQQAIFGVHEESEEDEMSPSHSNHLLSQSLKKLENDGHQDLPLVKQGYFYSGLSDSSEPCSRKLSSWWPRRVILVRLSHCKNPTSLFNSQLTQKSHKDTEIVV